MPDAFDGPLRGQRGRFRRSIERSAKEYGPSFECFNHPITHPFLLSPISRLIIFFYRDCADFYDDRDLSYEKEEYKGFAFTWPMSEGKRMAVLSSYDLFHVQCYFIYIYIFVQKGGYVVE